VTTRGCLRSGIMQLSPLELLLDAMIPLYKNEHAKG
jgi:hypothetical protein